MPLYPWYMMCFSYLLFSFWFNATEKTCILNYSSYFSLILLCSFSFYGFNFAISTSISFFPFLVPNLLFVPVFYLFPLSILLGFSTFSRTGRMNCHWQSWKEKDSGDGIQLNCGIGFLFKTSNLLLFVSLLLYCCIMYAFIWL